MCWLLYELFCVFLSFLLLFIFCFKFGVCMFGVCLMSSFVFVCILCVC